MRIIQVYSSKLYSLTGWDCESLPAHWSLVIRWRTDSAWGQMYFWRAPLINMRDHHSFTYISPPAITCWGKKGRKKGPVYCSFVWGHSRKYVRVENVNASRLGLFMLSCTPVLEETGCGINSTATVKKTASQIPPRLTERPHGQKRKASPNMLNWAGVTDNRAA